MTGRSLTLKDNTNRVLKDWHYEGSSTGYSESMTCLVKDIIALKPKENSVMKLYYASRDFPEGYQIANVVIGDKSTAALH